MGSEFCTIILFDVKNLKLQILVKFHRRMLREHAQEAFMDHKKYITELIPSERLLIYSVKEGWDPLVQFLGV